MSAHIDFARGSKITATSSRPRVAVMTSGGDCAGLNAAIKSVVDSAAKAGWDVIGIQSGLEGLYENHHVALNPSIVRDWEDQPSTNLFSTRKKYGEREIDRIIDNFRDLDCKALVVIGGDGSLSKVWEIAQRGDIKLIAIPKTIDQDIGLTQLSIGFQSAVEKVVDTIEDLKGTAKAHNRIFVVEAMGRNRGWIALKAAIDSNADAAIIPEIPYDIEPIAQHLKKRHAENRYSMLVVAEGAASPSGIQVSAGNGANSLGGIAKLVAGQIKQLTGIETYAHVVGHTQRGARPNWGDRALATHMGAFGMNLVLREMSGMMVSYDGTDVNAKANYRYVAIDEALNHKHVIAQDHPLAQQALAQGMFLNQEISCPLVRASDEHIERGNLAVLAAK